MKMKTTVTWANPNFVILPHQVNGQRYPEDLPDGSDHLPLQACHLKHLKGYWQDTSFKEFGMYFRVMCDGFLISMQ